ncbi:MAG: TolC family protein, partial [Polyangiaceae bacterium]
TCAGCSATTFGAGISDQAAIEDVVSGKRGLRLRVAGAALAAAKLSRVDAQRTLEYQVKQQYFQVVLARAAFDFAKEVQASSEQTLELNKKRYSLGAIDEGILARVETTKLESDQAVDTASANLRLARVSMAFLLGFRGHVPDFEVERERLNFAVPDRLQAPSAAALMRDAIEHRPDLKALGYQRDRAEASIDLEKRKRFPDIALSAQYTQTGTGQLAIQPPTIIFGISTPIPILYQNQGEIRRAEADYRGQTLVQARLYAQVAAEVESALTAFSVSKQLVERMESVLLARAKTARDIVKRQFEGGTTSLIDFLDAQRTFTATNLEYLQDLTNYWTAVAQLELAVGAELRK